MTKTIIAVHTPDAGTHIYASVQAAREDLHEREWMVAYRVPATTAADLVGTHTDDGSRSFSARAEFLGWEIL